mmetsp:Transcript_40407/g.65131  ORF Transcript_40407/g.65131 Transcript_40407/m.65131 type:complete len:311 (-) Transcript_40407:114-1046(-)
MQRRFTSGAAELIKRALSLSIAMAKSLIRKTLLTDKEFQDKMRVYLLKTQGTRTFYDNRLHFDPDGGLWMFVTSSRQCSCCGHMLTSHLGDNGKLLSCAICKVEHFCDRACQKSDWKSGHKSVCCRKEGKQGIEVVLHMCVRALFLMKFTSVVTIDSELLTVMSPDVMSSLFLQKTDERSKKYVELAKDRYPDGKDRVCEHFSEKQESNRILFPIWETATDNLAFVPISLDFLLNGLGVAEDLVQSFETKMSTNADMFFVVVMGMVQGELAVVGGSSFIAIKEIPCSSGASAGASAGASSGAAAGGAVGE